MLLGPRGPEESWAKSLKRDETVELDSGGSTKKRSVEGKNVLKHNKHLLKEKFHPTDCVCQSDPTGVCFGCRTKTEILQLFPWQQT